MSQELDRGTLSSLLQEEDIEKLSFQELTELFRQEERLQAHLPDGNYQVDPRNGDRVLYNASRAERPHDHQLRQPEIPEEDPDCYICQGDTTGVLDVADLSTGFTFINKNLFPMLYPFEDVHPQADIDRGGWPPAPTPRDAFGFHFLQWTCSRHDRDWHNLPLQDCSVVMQRLAALEKKLLGQETASPLRENGSSGGQGGYVSIIKNRGAAVGASLSHGHQQIAFSNVMPRRIGDNLQFQRRSGKPFAAHMLRHNPSELLVKDYGPALLLVPYFMRRPYDMLLILEDTGKQHLHQLSEREVEAAAHGWHDATFALSRIMPAIGKDFAYNITTSNGPGAGLYFEFLPFSQPTGGYEHLGLYVCQESPIQAAARLRQILES